MVWRHVIERGRSSSLLAAAHDGSACYGSAQVMRFTFHVLLPWLRK